MDDTQVEDAEMDDPAANSIDVDNFPADTTESGYTDVDTFTADTTEAGFTDVDAFEVTSDIEVKVKIEDEGPGWSDPFLSEQDPADVSISMSKAEMIYTTGMFIQH